MGDNSFDNVCWIGVGWQSEDKKKRINYPSKHSCRHLQRELQTACTHPLKSFSPAFYWANFQLSRANFLHGSTMKLFQLQKICFWWNNRSRRKMGREIFTQTRKLFILLCTNIKNFFPDTFLFSFTNKFGSLERKVKCLLRQPNPPCPLFHVSPSHTHALKSRRSLKRYFSSGNNFSWLNFPSTAHIFLHHGSHKPRCKTRRQWRKNESTFSLPVDAHGKRTESFSKVLIVVGLLWKLTSARTALSLIKAQIIISTPDRHCFKPQFSIISRAFRFSRASF